jgi:hypothetical protein
MCIVETYAAMCANPERIARAGLEAVVGSPDPVR